MASNVSFSGSVAENYERYLGPLLFEPYAIDLVNRIQPRKITRVLELACGTGRVTKHIANTVSPETSIIASDLNPDMISIARKKVNNLNVDWQVVDMQNISFDDNSFDLVICQYGIMFVPDKGKAYAEMYRVLRKDGVILMNAWDSLAKNPLFETANKVVNSFFPTDPVLFYQVPFSYHDEATMKKHLSDAGFHSAMIKHVRKNCTTNSAADVVKGLIEGNPAHGFILERNAALLPEIKKALEDEVTRQFGDRPCVCPMQAFVIEGIK
jgi:ubiquinone/menaquinone biosynthesis C-methylase UbiE